MRVTRNILTTKNYIAEVLKLTLRTVIYAKKRIVKNNYHLFI